MNIAKAVASRATCNRASVGAVVVSDDNRILSTGYNGSLPGELHCIDVGCLMVNGHCERTVHAETNAVAQAAKYGVSVRGAKMYVWSSHHHTDSGTAPTCLKCRQVSTAAGIVQVIEGGG